MREEYRKAMEKISLSDSDRARILANVRQSYQNLEENDKTNAMPGACDDLQQEAAPYRRFHYTMPRCSWRKTGAAAAAVVALLTSMILISSQFFGRDSDSDGDPAASVAAVKAVPEDDWQEFGSVEEIEKKTDCRTYTLGNMSKDYRVKKVKVSNVARHVKIVYQHRNRRDKIVFEYREAESAPEIKNQFSGEKKLSVEKVKNLDVCMYGEGKCSGMMWEKESCTFGVKMTKACSKAKAKRLVSGTEEGISHKAAPNQDGNASESGEIKGDLDKNEPEWDTSGKGDTQGEKRRVLNRIYRELGFHVTVDSPAEDIRYRLVDEHELFAFHYEENEDLAGCRITGSAGWEDCPKGTLDDYSEYSTFEAEGTEVTLYREEGGRRAFTFKKQEIQFVLRIEDWQGEEEEAVFSELFPLFRVSLQDEEEEGAAKSERVAVLRRTAQKIQNAVSEKNMKKMADYLQFPLSIKDLKMVVNSKSGWLELAQSDIFTPEWIEAVTDYDTRLIKADTAEFNMGDEDNYLLCRIQDDTVLISEIHRKKAPSASEPEEEPEESSPEEEEIPEDSPEPTDDAQLE